MYFSTFGPPTRFKMDPKPRDLEERSTQFAEKIRYFVRQLPRTVSNLEDTKQLIRASGSVPANCIEANEALGTKDRIMKFRISRKEAKECQLWLRLLNTGESTALDAQRMLLRQEAQELKLIFNAIVRKLE